MLESTFMSYQEELGLANTSFEEFVNSESELIDGEDGLKNTWNNAVQDMIDKFANGDEEDSFVSQASNVYEEIIEAQRQYNAEVAELDLTDTVTDMQNWATKSNEIASTNSTIISQYGDENNGMIKQVTELYKQVAA
jgi:hypothetical protein